MVFEYRRVSGLLRIHLLQIYCVVEKFIFPIEALFNVIDAVVRFAAVAMQQPVFTLNLRGSCSNWRPATWISL